MSRQARAALGLTPVGETTGPAAVSSVVDRIIGGWSLSLNAKVQSGLLVNIGNVRLVGMSEQDVQDLFKLRFADDGRIYMWPQDIIDETIKAYSTSVTSATGYAGEAPSGRYFAPANGPDCIEVAPSASFSCATLIPEGLSTARTSASS